ncbi:MAG: HEPN domain-containing protein [Lachnospiraceae bacterium]|nr:HEPN domain-containing protein [Lachnospiraceae bacterium]
MDDVSKWEMSRYRMESAVEHLNASSYLLEGKFFKDSIGRSYYAMFSATRALLALDGVDFSKHAGVISYFQREYIKTGKFDKEYSKYLSEAFRIRNHSDYADFYVASKQDAEEQHERADKFCSVVKEYIAKQQENQE